VLTGAEEILGIENPTEGFSEEEAKKKWGEVSNNLYENQIIYNKNSEIHISDYYAKISEAISFPDVAFEYTRDAQEKNYVYIRGSIYVSLKKRKDEELKIKLYDNREDFIEFLIKEFMLSHCDSDISIMLSEFEMDKALDFHRKGKPEQALELFNQKDFDFDELQIAIELFLENKCSIDFIGYRNNQETPSQALFRSIKTEKGTWLYKIWNSNTKICKCSIDKALSEALYF